MKKKTNAAIIKIAMKINRAALGIVSALVPVTLYAQYQNIPTQEAYQTIVVIPENDGSEKQALYDVSIDLMYQGYKAEREDAVIEDAEYIAQRGQAVPQYGIYYGYTEVPISVQAENEHVTDDEFNYIVYCLAAMDQGFLSRISRDDWKVIVLSGEMPVSNGLIEGREDKLSYKGMTDFSTNTVYVYADSDVIFHEVGHIVSYYAYDALKGAGYFEYSTDGELACLYCHRRAASHSVYVYTNPAEQLADCYYDYLFYPREMQAQAPGLYQIISDTVDGGAY